MLRDLTDPQVAVDPDVAVDRSSLGPRVRRAAVLAGERWITSIGGIVSSEEAKAVETAAVLAGSWLPVEQRRRWARSIDRRPVPAARSFRGGRRWLLRPAVGEVLVVGSAPLTPRRASSAALADLLADDTPGDIAVVGHGGVGTLWYCHLAGLEIDRRWDQPGQGHYFSVSRATGRPLHHWRPFEMSPDP